MVSCYKCGESGANYRRNVVTGTSSGTYYGKRTSYSSRTYRGTRSLCEECAFQLDRANIISVIVICWITALILIYLIVRFKFL